jgi:hypothetical protein
MKREGKKMSQNCYNGTHVCALGGCVCECHNSGTERATVRLFGEAGNYQVSVDYNGTGIIVGEYRVLSIAADFAERHVRLVQDVLGIPCDLILGNEK